MTETKVLQGTTLAETKKEGQCTEPGCRTILSQHRRNQGETRCILHPQTEKLKKTPHLIDIRDNPDAYQEDIESIREKLRPPAA